MGTTFKEPSMEEYAIDTNIKVKKIKKKLKGISYMLLKSMGRKPRFSLPEVCHDWQAVLYELKYHIDNLDVNQNNQLKKDTFGSYAWLNTDTWSYNYIKKRDSRNVRFGLGFADILNKYRKYIFNDSILHKYYECVVSMNQSVYDPNNRHFIFSPMYTLYFLILMNKRFFYHLSVDYYEKGKKSNKKTQAKFEFINDNEISENIANILDGKPLGKYISDRLTSLLNHLKRLLNSYAESYYENTDGGKEFKKYFDIYTNVFNTIYDMNIFSTGINEEWLNSAVAKINNMKELHNEMALGRSNLFYPTDDHVNNLNYNIQEIEKIANSFERDNEYRRKN
jgi:hypothetical protein